MGHPCRVDRLGDPEAGVQLEELQRQSKTKAGRARLVTNQLPVRLDQKPRPDTGILRNKLGIGDADQLAETEHAAAALGAAHLLAHPNLLGRQWTLQRWQATHEYLFGDIYDWAGQFRTINIGKGDHTFHPVSHLNIATNYIAGQLTQIAQHRYPDTVSLVTDLSSVLADMNEAHPFREGNGRTQRPLISQLAD